MEGVDVGLDERFLDEHHAARVPAQQRKELGERRAAPRFDAVLLQELRRQRTVTRVGRDDGDVHGIAGLSIESFWGGPRNCGTPVITPWKLSSGSPTTMPFLAMRNSRMVSSW